MMKIITFGRCFVFMASLVCAAAYAVPAHAQSAGYEGLIAPAAPDDSPQNKAPENSNEEPGYNGVVSGAVPRETPPLFTPIPNRDGQPDLSVLSNLYAQDRNGDGVPDKIASSKRIFFTGFHAHVKGKSAMEYMVEQNINDAMNDLKNPAIPPAVRATNAKQSYEDLASLAEGLRNKRMVPDKTYQQMGLQDSYIEETKTGIDNSLAALDRALAELKPYQ